MVSSLLRKAEELLKEGYVLRMGACQSVSWPDKHDVYDTDCGQI